MKRIITYGDHSAALFTGERRAVLVTDQKSLPLKLADALDETEGIFVHSVHRNDYGSGNIEMAHNLSFSDLLAEICDAIAQVYDSDTAISNVHP